MNMSLDAERQPMEHRFDPRGGVLTVTYVAPFLASVLFATHLTNWFRQAGVIGTWPYPNTYEFDFLSPYIPWFDPVFAALAAVALVSLVVAQRRSPLLWSFNHGPAGVTGLAALAVGAAGGMFVVFAFTGTWLTDPLSLSFGAALALAFKLLAVVTVWKALRSSRRTEAMASTQVQTNDPRFPLTAILVLAAAIHLLFPARVQLMSIVGSLVAGALLGWLSPFETGLRGWSIDAIAAILIARYFLQRGFADGVFSLQASPRLIRVALAFAALFVLAATVAMILSAIPYGGGHVPAQAKSVFAVTQLIGIWVIYKGLLHNAASARARRAR